MVLRGHGVRKVLIHPSVHWVHWVQMVQMVLIHRAFLSVQMDRIHPVGQAVPMDLMGRCTQEALTRREVQTDQMGRLVH